MIFIQIFHLCDNAVLILLRANQAVRIFAHVCKIVKCHLTLNCATGHTDACTDHARTVRRQIDRNRVAFFYVGWNFHEKLFIVIIRIVYLDHIR